MIDKATQKELFNDPDGLVTYEYIANNIDECIPDLDFLIENMIRVDLTGQFVISAARYLHAIDAEGLRPHISRLVASGIVKDRERRYLPDLIRGIYGDDYRERAAELSATDDNFRRIFKRLYPIGI